MAVPPVRNVMQKEVENKLKYKILCLEVERVWNMKGVIVPVITGTTGMAAEG